MVRTSKLLYSVNCSSSRRLLLSPFLHQFFFTARLQASQALLQLAYNSFLLREDTLFLRQQRLLLVLHHDRVLQMVLFLLVCVLVQLRRESELVLGGL